MPGIAVARVPMTGMAVVAGVAVTRAAMRGVAVRGLAVGAGKSRQAKRED